MWQVMITNVSPASDQFEETLNSLKCAGCVVVVVVAAAAAAVTSVSLFWQVRQPCEEYQSGGGARERGGHEGER